jgi:hypothetical protein
MTTTPDGDRTPRGKMTTCPWCNGTDTDDPWGLCLMHEAEYLGTTMADLERGDREQYAEWLDTLG